MQFLQILSSKKKLSKQLKQLLISGPLQVLQFLLHGLQVYDSR